MYVGEIVRGGGEFIYGATLTVTTVNGVKAGHSETNSSYDERLGSDLFKMIKCKHDAGVLVSVPTLSPSFLYS